MSKVAKGYCILMVSTLTAALQIQAEEIGLKSPGLDLSFRNEIQHAIDRGLAWLTTNQNASGWWSTADHPATTALALMTFMGAPERRYRTNPPPTVTRGYAYLVDSAKPDGSIYRTALKNYNTAISVTALVMANNPAYDSILRRGRAYLISSQNDFGEPGKVDDALDGGVGYGDKYKHADVNNMLFALEAIRATEYLVKDKNLPDTKDLNWNAAIQFLQNCQNLPSHNSQEWVSKDPKDKGGFVYFPGYSMAGGVTNKETGKVALRSYGSISYAGLLSYVYADLKKEDARVAAVLDWLQSNYTLQENPGMGQEGFYYYLHLMTKALNAVDVDTLELKDGSKINWRRAVAMRLLNLQRPDGSWYNDNNRWWEKDPNIVTAYALMALEVLWWNGQPRASEL